MALRRPLGWLAFVALAACALTACKGGDAKDDAKGAPQKQAAAQPSLEQLNQRCEQMGKACGEKEKHQEKIIEECKQAAKGHVEKGCGDKAVALYDCYEKEICATDNKVWAIEDLRVLAERHGTCVAEQNAGLECLGAK